MYLANLTGILMKVQEDPVTRYLFEVWFDYTRCAINTISESAMVIVPNFAGNDEEIHYSILEITSILPMHYALGSDTSGYPGFVVEAARNAGQDWMIQDSISTEDTTKIRCVAMPTNLEIVERPFASGEANEPIIQEESNLPMVGHPVYLLNAATTERVANKDLDLERDNVIQIGNLVRNPEVHAHLRVEELIKVHFGIFGFTGAGKSNLLSTLVRKLLTESQTPLKVVIFDLMSEYTALLLDLLVELDHARIINLGAQTVPGSVLEHFDDRNNGRRLERAASDFLRSTVLPKTLKRQQDELLPAFRELFVRRKIWMWQQQQQTIGQFIASIRQDVLRGNMGNSAQAVRNLVQELQRDFEAQPFEEDAAQDAISRIDTLAGQVKTTTAANNLDVLKRRLEDESNRSTTDIPPSALVQIPQMIDRLNQEDQSSLFIIQAHNPDELRHFSWMLGNFTYERRRQRGQIAPLIGFIFDEADEFIPGQARGTYAESSDVAMTLARRGRKFGMGIGIATQRIRYLNTSILAQPHTYFVSKLPRQSDRQAIAEAFGISEEMFSQTFKFKKGDWLLASYDAAGLEAIPIPIHAENAEDRILQFLARL
jgi:hypothetical protein